jgi:hypothetical protein
MNKFLISNKNNVIIPLFILKELEVGSGGGKVGMSLQYLKVN